MLEDVAIPFDQIFPADDEQRMEALRLIVACQATIAVYRAYRALPKEPQPAASEESKKYLFSLMAGLAFEAAKAVAHAAEAKVFDLLPDEQRTELGVEDLINDCKHTDANNFRGLFLRPIRNGLSFHWQREDVEGIARQIGEHKRGEAVPLFIREDTDELLDTALPVAWLVPWTGIARPFDRPEAETETLFAQLARFQAALVQVAHAVLAALARKTAGTQAETGGHPT